jgi:hypothetical protein
LKVFALRRKAAEMTVAIFDRASIKRILDAVTLPVCVKPSASSFNDIAERFLMAQDWSAQPVPSKVAKDMVSIESHAQKLLKILKAGRYFSGRDETQSIISGLRLLAGWSVEARTRDNVKDIGSETRKSLVLDLGELYKRLYGREPGFSITAKSDTPSGDFVRFVEAFTQELDSKLYPGFDGSLILKELENLTPHAIRERTRKR